jgi:cell division protein FtsB
MLERQKECRADKINIEGGGSLEAEIAKLKSEADALAGEIGELTGQSPAMEADARSCQ